MVNIHDESTAEGKWHRAESSLQDNGVLAIRTPSRFRHTRFLVDRSDANASWDDAHVKLHHIYIQWKASRWTWNIADREPRCPRLEDVFRETYPSLKVELDDLVSPVLLNVHGELTPISLHTWRRIEEIIKLIRPIYPAMLNVYCESTKEGRGTSVFKYNGAATIDEIIKLVRNYQHPQLNCHDHHSISCPNPIVQTSSCQSQPTTPRFRSPDGADPRSGYELEAGRKWITTVLGIDQGQTEIPGRKSPTSMF